jgi:hypothetical protein
MSWLLIFPFSLLIKDAVIIGLFSVGDRFINEYGTFGGMKIGRGKPSTRRIPVHNKSHMM